MICPIFHSLFAFEYTPPLVIELSWGGGDKYQLTTLCTRITIFTHTNFFQTSSDGIYAQFCWPRVTWTWFLLTQRLNVLCQQIILTTCLWPKGLYASVSWYDGNRCKAQRKKSFLVHIFNIYKITHSGQSPFVSIRMVRLWSIFILAVILPPYLFSVLVCEDPFLLPLRVEHFPQETVNVRIINS